MLLTAVVFVPLFGVLSLLDCFLGREGWYLIDLKQTADANHYFGEAVPFIPLTPHISIFRLAEDCSPCA